jgi:hypothetical protein
MEIKTKSLGLTAVALVGVALFILSPSAFPQSCALCYTQAASSGSRMIEALRSGILVLIVPPTLMWLVLGAILYAKRNQFKNADNASGSGSSW